VEALPRYHRVLSSEALGVLMGMMRELCGSTEGPLLKVVRELAMEALPASGGGRDRLGNPVSLPDFKSYREQPGSRLVLAHFQLPAAGPGVRYVAANCRPFQLVGDSDGDRSEVHFCARGAIAESRI
jgi:hypothetical protein